MRTGEARPQHLMVTSNLAGFEPFLWKGPSPTLGRRKLEDFDGRLMEPDGYVSVFAPRLPSP
jgi:hypothetical protein